MKKEIKVVVVGMGFMGKIHASLWLLQKNVKLVGVVDARSENSLRPEMNKAGVPAAVPLVASMAEAIRDLEPDVVDLCTPTYLHEGQAQVALAAGCHLFCEKPMTLDLASADAILRAAKKANRKVMVGHCIRFWPEYEMLRETIESKPLGELLFLDMERTAGRPGYIVGGWTNDPERCVGAALDMHIHDADWIHSVFGLPDSVASSGVKLSSGWDYLATHYHYANGTSISARGGWCLPPSAPLRMAFQAVFEKGSLEWSSAGKEGLIQVSDRGREVVLDSNEDDPLVAYRREIEYFLSCISEERPVARANGSQARDSLRLVLAEIESAGSGKITQLTADERE